VKLNDSGNAERLVSIFGDELLYCPQMRAWYIWTGRMWKMDISNHILQIAQQVAESYRTLSRECDVDDISNRNKLIRHANTSESLRGLQAMVSIAQSDQSIILNVNEFDHNPMLLNVENGTIDLATGKFILFNPDDHITKMAPVTYVKDADCPVWDRFLSDVLPDAATRAFIQTAVGYSLTASTREDRMFILHGGGRNGKTTFVNAILSMMGEYASQASSSLIVRKHSTGPRDDLLVLMGKRFVVATETEESHKLDENLVKQMTGGSRVSINPKYRSQMEFHPTWKMWLDTNYEPIITGTDPAIWRRLLKIPFYVSIPEAKCDTKLRQYLMSNNDERSGILNWALEGAKRWSKTGLKPSKVVVDSTKFYSADQDFIGQFIAECCQLHPNFFVTKNDLYDVYLAFCRQNNEQSKTKNAFGRNIIGRGISESRNTNDRYWQGISINMSVSLLPCDAV